MESGTTLGDVCEAVLNKHPSYWDRFTNEEKIIQFNMLGADGKYFDKLGGRVKQIPPDMLCRLDDNYDPILRPK